MSVRGLVVVVDPFGSGRELAPEFRRAGWDTVAVLSSGSLPAAFVGSLRPGDFTAVVGPEDDLDALAGRLAALRPAAVVPGFETGVELADLLTDRLGTPGNGAALSVSRRHKGEMAARLRECGVPCADYVATGDLDALLAWVRGHGRWPVVVKPAASGGSDSINTCTSLAEVEAAYRSIVGHPNVLGLTNAEVIGQEFLAGRQYLVNSVSVDGHHYVGEIWRFDSLYEDGTQIYDKQELLASTGDPQDALVDYALQVLGALGIRYGAAHTEIMLTDRGPLLIECAARMTGGINREALHRVLGYDHIALTVEACTDPDRLRARPARYRMHQRLGIVALRAPGPGRLAGDALDRLLALPTLVGSTKPLVPGTAVERTRSFLTSPGLLYLVGDTVDDILRDTRAVRELEASGGLYATEVA